MIKTPNLLFRAWQLELPTQELLLTISVIVITTTTGFGSSNQIADGKSLPDLQYLPTTQEKKEEIVDFFEPLKSGNFHVDQTITSPSTQGWAISGQGSCTPTDSSPYTDWISKDATKLFAGSDFEGPLILATGAHGAIRNVALLGWSSLQDKQELDNKPGHGVGIRSANLRKEFGGTKNIISNVAFGGFEVAIDLSLPGKLGNDNLVIRDCQICRCNTAIRISANQAVATFVFNLNANFTEQVIHGEAGADLTIIGADVGSDSTLLHVTGDGTHVAENNGFYCFKHFRVDNREPLTFTFIRPGNEKARYTALFEDIRLPAWKEKKVRLSLTGKDQRADLNHIHNLPVDTIFDPGPGIITVRNTILRTQPNQLIPPEATGQLRLINCEYKGLLISETIIN